MASTDKPPENKDICAVFTSGWAKPHGFYSTFFRYDQLEILTPEAKKVVVRDSTINLTLGKDMTIAIKKVFVDGYLIGLWYPSSQCFDFDVAERELVAKYPEAKTGVPDFFSIKSLKEPPKGSDNFDVLLECGSEFSAFRAIADFERHEYFLQKTKLGPYCVGYVPYYVGSLHSDLSDGAYTTITVEKHTYCGKHFAIYYISGVRGDTVKAEKLMALKYPNAEQHDINNFESVLLSL